LAQFGLPVTFVDVPAGHGEHAMLPGVSVNEPVAQSEQLVAPGKFWLEPASHSRQSRAPELGIYEPDAQGWQVDAAARAFLIQAGYPEYQHALGHHLGRVAHDGSTLLGPKWERYGQTPYGVVEVGNVFTLELGTEVPGRGYVGLEEDVLVTGTGIEWLSKPQRDIWVI